MNSTYLGSNKMEVNIKDIKALISIIEQLTSEIRSRGSVTSQARSVARGASSKYSQSYVSNAANNVQNICSTIESSNMTIAGDLTSLVKDLNDIINGYLALEQDLAQSGGSRWD